MLLKCCTQYDNKFGKLNSGHKTGKGQLFSQFQKGNAKDFSNCRTIGLVLQTNKVVFKVLQASAVHDQELSDV